MNTIEVKISITLEFSDLEELIDRIYDVIDSEEQYESFDRLDDDNNFSNYVNTGERSEISKYDIVDFIKNYGDLIARDYDLEDLFRDTDVEISKI